jgi:predicted nucleic acid-binding protein
VIVVDTNVLAHLMLGGAEARRARALFVADPRWCAPLLWRSEFRNVLALQMRHAGLSEPAAFALMERAEALLRGREYEAPSTDVLRLAGRSTCTAYDCEFVAVAERLKTRLVTLDRTMLRRFPATTVALKDAVAS